MILIKIAAILLSPLLFALYYYIIEVYNIYKS